MLSRLTVARKCKVAASDCSRRFLNATNSFNKSGDEPFPGLTGGPSGFFSPTVTPEVVDFSEGCAFSGDPFTPARDPNSGLSRKSWRNEAPAGVTNSGIGGGSMDSSSSAMLAQEFGSTDIDVQA